MLTYEDLLIECDKMKIITIEKYFKSNAGGLCVGNKIAINKAINNSADKLCILAEEIGHFLTTVGDITDQTKAENRKQENQARRYAHNIIIGLSGLIEAWENDCSNLYETAEFLNVNIGFLTETIEHYTAKYGSHVDYNGYRITFIPYMGIMPLLKP